MHCNILTKAVAAAAVSSLAGLPLISPVIASNLARRHISLATPKPFISAEYGPTNPLSPTGSDFPCKIPAGQTPAIDGSPTEMVVGEEQIASFDGFAVHGGGSCQFALTSGFQPTKDSAWKVIHSIQGGCPKANIAGNLEAGQTADNHTFTIPEDFEAGNYTFAWTWLNRIGGQPEFYMNCAPIAVKAAAGSTRRAKKRRRDMRNKRDTTEYPDLFLANLGQEISGSCNTSAALYQQAAISYPHPGNSISYPEGTDNLFEQPCDGNVRNTNVDTTALVGTSSASSINAPISQPSTASVTKSSSAPNPSSTSTTSTAPSSSTGLSSASTFASSSTGVLSTATSQPSAPATLTTATPTSTSAAALDRPCTDGHLLCVGETQFSTCTGGKWTAPQNLASNARCTVEGESVGLSITNSW